MFRILMIIIFACGLFIGTGIETGLQGQLENEFMPVMVNFPTPENTCSYVPGRIVVKFKSMETLPTLTHQRDKREYLAHTFILKSYGVKPDSIRKSPSGLFYIMETDSEGDIPSLCQQLRKEPLVLDASPDYIAHIASVEPNDPYFQYQYSLNNTGQIYVKTLDFRGTSGCDIKALSGWQWTCGNSEIIIAVVDSGVALDQEDLKNKILPGYNFVDDNDYPYDDNSHGTFSASIAAAEADNGAGIAGVSWYSPIMPIKTMRADGGGNYTDIAAGVTYAADHGAQVINLSVGGASPSFILEDACKYAYEKGCVLIAATGNTGSAVLYPAAYDDYCLAVGASDADDKRADFSNFGPSIDVVAPGYAICGAYFDPSQPEKLNVYGWNSGTSFATPIVSGAAALLLALKPFLTNKDVMDLIRYTADDVNSDTYPGVDDYMGYGRINLERLLEPYILQ